MLVEHLLDGMSNPTSRRMVEDFLGKEVANGNLARLSNGNYSLVDSSSNGVVATSAPQQNGDAVIPKTKTSTPYKEVTSTPYDLKEFEAFATAEQPDRAKTPRQTSPELEPMKKEDCYEIIIGRRLLNEETNSSSKIFNGKLENGCHKEDSIKHNGRTVTPPNMEKEESKNVVETTHQTNHKRSKTERKQRLCVRSDDSTDLVFKYEEYRKESSYKDEQDKRDDTNDKLSEDGEGDQDAGRSSTNTSPTPSGNNASGFRSARRKRAKKVFDPSDNMVVKRKRGRYSNAAKALANAQQDSQDIAKPAAVKESPKDPNRQCSLCSQEKQEALTACRDCTVRAHPSCIYTPEEMIHKAHTSWQCDRCKTCSICYETSEVGPLATCSNCNETYHYSCHTPRPPASKAKWICHECNQKQFKTSTNDSNSNWNNNKPSQKSNSNWNSSNNNSEQQSNNSIASALASPQVSPIRNGPEHMDDDNSRDNIDPNIPDASDWSSEQVYQYFARLFPKEAEVFRNQEIDGHSLMLLKRSDVLTGFDLLLGPALKIYRHVLKLQIRKDDTKFYWL